MQKRGKVCKFKEKCPQFLANTSCGFDHVECKFKDKCKDKQKCMFYHLDKPQSNLSKPQFKQGMSQTLCKFGSACSRANCAFKHQQPRNTQIKQNFPKSNKQCHFGAKCKNASCSYRHPQRQAVGDSNIQQNSIFSQNRINENMSVPQMNSNSNNRVMAPQNNRIQRAVAPKLCYQFMMNNVCNKGAMCQKPHQFTQKGTIKRLYFTTEFPIDKNAGLVFYQYIRNERENRTKQMIYVLHENSWFDFKKLVSSQKIYQEIGQIGNQDNLFFLRSLKPNACDVGSRIFGIQTFIFRQIPYLVFLAGNQIHVYNTTTGSTSMVPSEKMNNKLTGVVLRNQTLLIATLQEQIVQLSYNTNSQCFEPKQTYKLSNQPYKKFKQTEQQLLGQTIIYGISKSQKMVFFNHNFEAMELKIGDGVVIEDADVGLWNNKIPTCFITTSSGRLHQVIAINLLNFQFQSVMTCDFNSGLNKICIIQNQIFVEVKNKGFLIYKMGQFQQQIGMIPLRNQVQELRKDKNGNLTILQSKTTEHSGSLSIFKVRNG